MAKNKKNWDKGILTWWLFTSKHWYSFTNQLLHRVEVPTIVPLSLTLSPLLCPSHFPFGNDPDLARPRVKWVSGKGEDERQEWLSGRLKLKVNTILGALLIQAEMSRTRKPLFWVLPGQILFWWLPRSPLTLKLRMLLPVDKTGYLLP